MKAVVVTHITPTNSTYRFQNTSQCYCLGSVADKFMQICKSLCTELGAQNQDNLKEKSKCRLFRWALVYLLSIWLHINSVSIVTPNCSNKMHVFNSNQHSSWTNYKDFQWQLYLSYECAPTQEGILLAIPELCAICSRIGKSGRNHRSPSGSIQCSVPLAEKLVILAKNSNPKYRIKRFPQNSSSTFT